MEGISGIRPGQRIRNPVYFSIHQTVTVFDNGSVTTDAYGIMSFANSIFVETVAV